MAQHEYQARKLIDQLLHAAGWLVQDADAAHISATRGVAIREFPLKRGHGFADYLRYVDGKAAGVIAAKKKGTTLTGVEIQSNKYTKGLPQGLPAWHYLLPFSYQSTGVETRFTNGLDPAPRSRPVFAFHTSALLAEWLDAPQPHGVQEPFADYLGQGRDLLPDLHANGGGRVLSRSTNPMTSFIASHA